MENFAIDLDKVLDEFEFNEDQASSLITSDLNSISLVASDLNSILNHDRFLDKNCYSGPTVRYDSPFEPVATLNLEEADFGPSSKTASSISNYNSTSDFPSQNGHINPGWKISTSFIPQEPSIGCTNSPQLSNNSMNGSLTLSLKDNFCKNNDKSILYHKEVTGMKKIFPSVEDESQTSFLDFKRNQHHNDSKYMYLDGHSTSRCSKVKELVPSKKYCRPAVSLSNNTHSKECLKYLPSEAIQNDSQPSDVSCSPTQSCDLKSSSPLTHYYSLKNNHESATGDCSLENSEQMVFNSIHYGTSLEENSNSNEVIDSSNKHSLDVSIHPKPPIVDSISAVGFEDLGDVSDSELEAYLTAEMCGLNQSPNKELAELDIYLKTVEESDDSLSQVRTGAKPKVKICPQTEVISDKLKNLNTVWDNISIETTALKESSEPLTWDDIKLGVESLPSKQELDNLKECVLNNENSFSVVHNSSVVSDRPKGSNCNNVAESKLLEMEHSHNPCTEHNVKPFAEHYVKPCMEQTMTWNDIKLDLTTDTVRLNIMELPTVEEENEITSMDLKIQEANLDAQQAELLNHVSLDSLPSDIICNNVELNDSLYRITPQNNVLDNRYCENNNDGSLDLTEAARPQKRPTSLNLPPRAEFNPNRNRDNLESPMTPIPEDSLLDEALNDLSDVSPSSSSTPTIQPQPTLSEGEKMLGKIPPYWIPDGEAPNCMQCETRFTMIKRRHHCRACGKVLCSSCCNVKSKLVYMDNKEARVCQKCQQTLTKDSSQPRPGGIKTRTLRPSETASCFTSLIPEAGDQLPPILISTGSTGEVVLEEMTDQDKLMTMIRNDDDPTPVVFVVSKNLFVLVKIIHLDCCVNRTCWCFTTKGMCTVGQDEIIIILECLPDEKTIPRDIFCHFNTVYEEASKGNTVGDLSHTIFSQTVLDSREHGGFLYIRPSFQCLHKLILPSPPYVVGILLQKWETPWVKVFPIRLLLRLGAEYRYYPCPLVSVRFRKPVYGEVGHTIMNLLADFRNYQYMLTCIKGVAIHMEDKKTYINFPRNRYDEVMKVLNNSNEHVLALGANFSMEADSHLVCVQNDDGNYQTQAINIQNKPRKVTGASFVVFSGALKSSSGLTAKSSIVEDGLMVQIFAECLSSLKQSLRDMREYTIECGPTGASQPDELVTVRWAEDDKNVNIGVISPIDHMPMDGISSIRIHNSTDYMGEHLLLRWTEVFFVQNDESTNQSRLEPVDLSRLSETVAQACCIALTGHLEELKKANMTKIGLRVTIEAEKVGYEVGSSGCKFPAYYMNALDNELIPVIHRAASHSQEGAIILELIFHVLEY